VWSRHRTNAQRQLHEGEACIKESTNRSTTNSNHSSGGVKPVRMQSGNELPIMTIAFAHEFAEGPGQDVGP
jgi:hypothetical protein